MATTMKPEAIMMEMEAVSNSSRVCTTDLIVYQAMAPTTEMITAQTMISETITTLVPAIVSSAAEQ